MIGIDGYLRLAKEAAVAAGVYLKKRRDICIDEDLAHDIKLSTDKDSEKIIIDYLSSSGLPVLSEECGVIGTLNGLHWIIDPLDGTVNYFKGLDDLCCVSIALFDGDEPILGVIYRFATDEMIYGITERGAWLNEAQVKPSSVTAIRNAVAATGFPNAFDHSESNIASIIRIVSRAKKTRLLGSASLMAAFVACGRVDVYFEQGIRLWDVAGAMAIVQAAGGFTRLENVQDDFTCDFYAFATEALMKDFYGT